MEAIRFRLQ